MKVLIAPDSFGDTLTAVQAADAIADGWRTARSDDHLTLAPQSDGGPGFVDVLARQFGEVRTTGTVGPLGAPTEATWLWDARAEPTAYLECAQVCGLSLLPDGPTPQTAVSGNTAGLAPLIRDAVDAGAQRIVVGLGGSATNDGGRGMLEALGGFAAAARLLTGVELIAATDVTNPLLGEFGAVAVFGAQKGADAATRSILEERMTVWANELAIACEQSVAELPGAGAAGGLGAALLALGADAFSGATVIAEATAQDAALSEVDLVITGEGKCDQQTLRGKVVASLSAAAGRYRVPTVVLAGQVTLTPAEIAQAGLLGAYSVVSVAGSVESAMSDASTHLRALAAQVAGRGEMEYEIRRYR